MKIDFKKSNDTGLIIYNLDDDELANRLGSRIQEKNITNFEIIKYSGPKEYPTSKYSKKDWNELDFLTRDKLQLEGLFYYRKNIYPILRKIIIDINPKVYIELHSSTDPIYNSLFPWPWIKNTDMWCEIYPTPANKSLISILHFYTKIYKDFIIEKKLPVHDMYLENADVFHLPSYHGLCFELLHRDVEKIPKEYLDSGEMMLKHLCDFLMTNYRII